MDSCRVSPAELNLYVQSHCWPSLLPTGSPQGRTLKVEVEKPHHVGAIAISPLTNQFRELSLKSGQDSHTVEKEGCLLRVCEA